MSAAISSNKTIAKNTVFLYFRMMFTMAVSLFTSRVNLSVLGIEDNGIYQVVGGVVAVFSFLNGSLSGATSRFLTYELGKGDKIKLKETFVAALNIHILVAIIIFIFAETVGLWLLETKLVIPIDRMSSARLVFQLSIVATMVSIVQVPYNASIISHERMNVFAYLSILDVSLKLGVCYLLYVIPFDKLATFAVLVLFVQLITQTIYHVYCRKHFEECRFGVVKNMTIIKPILSFSSWDLLGNFSVMARGNGVNVILNMFFGPAINAACGFATSLGNAVYGFANNFMVAIRPPIVKAYSVADFIKMESLMINASKYSFCLLLLLSTPVIFESSFILKIWLKTPPEYTDVFCVFELLLSLYSSLFLPLVFAIHATGKIRFMSMVNGSIWLMTLPITYVLLSMGFPPIVPYATKVGLLGFVAISNMYNVKKLIPAFDVVLYLKKAVLPSLILVIAVILPTFITHSYFKGNEIVRFFSICIISTLSTLIGVYYIILNNEQRQKVVTRISYIIRK